MGKNSPYLYLNMVLFKQIKTFCLLPSRFVFQRSIMAEPKLMTTHLPHSSLCGLTTWGGVLHNTLCTPRIACEPWKKSKCPRFHFGSKYLWEGARVDTFI